MADLARKSDRLLAAVVISFLCAQLCPLAAVAEETSAAQRVAAMANRIASAQRLAVSAECTYDVVQASGQKIEFGERRDHVLLRPNRGRVDLTRRDGSRAGLVFDGKQLTAFDLEEKVYATAAKRGDIDTAFAYFTDDLRMRMPLRELFAADLPQRLKDSLASAQLVGVESLRGTETDHIALRLENNDVQVWIARDGEPLPQRIVITYRRAEGQPQFRADFYDWNFAPEAADALFTFVPQADANKISIRARKRGVKSPRQR